MILHHSIGTTSTQTLEATGQHLIEKIKPEIYQYTLRVLAYVIAGLSLLGLILLLVNRFALKDTVIITENNLTVVAIIFGFLIFLSISFIFLHKTIINQTDSMIKELLDDRYEMVYLQECVDQLQVYGTLPTQKNKKVFNHVSISTILQPGNTITTDAQTGIGVVYGPLMSLFQNNSMKTTLPRGVNITKGVQFGLDENMANKLAAKSLFVKTGIAFPVCLNNIVFGGNTNIIYKGLTTGTITSTVVEGMLNITEPIVLLQDAVIGA